MNAADPISLAKLLQKYVAPNGTIYCSLQGRTRANDRLLIMRLLTGDSNYPKGMAGVYCVFDALCCYAGIEKSQCYDDTFTYTALDLVTPQTLQQYPEKANFIKGEALHIGIETPKDDINALKHFIISALHGSEAAMGYMHVIYAKYDCHEQAMVMALQNAPFGGRFTNSVKGQSLSGTPQQKINAQKKSQLLTMLFNENAGIKQYPFDAACVIDAEVKKLVLDKE